MSGPERIFYEKRGRRYVEVSRYDAEVATPVGTHLVVATPGLKTTYYQIDPDHAAILAGAEVARDAMVKALQKASDWTVTNRDKDGFPAAMSRKSACDVVDAGIAALLETVDRQRKAGAT